VRQLGRNVENVDGAVVLDIAVGNKNNPHSQRSVTEPTSRG